MVEPDPTSVPPTPVRAVRVAERIAAQLRERILSGQLAGAALPTQEALMASFGVSAPSLREALRILEVEGLITVRRGKLGGADVHRPDGASVAHAIGLTLQGEGTSVRQLAEAVLLMEPLCAAACATLVDRLQVLRPAVEENLRRSADAVGDGPEFTRLGRRFHELLVDATPNPAVRLLARSLVAVWSTQEQEWAGEAAELGRYPDAAGQQAVMRAHRRIAEAIYDGDSVTSEAAARRHLEATQKLVLSEFGSRPIDATSPAASAGFQALSFRARQGPAPSDGGF
jgi:DNA-binding FadR family transcriptional regulator